MKYLNLPLLALVSLPAAAWAGVTVTSPLNGETVGVSAKYTASSTTSTCSKGVASMGVYVDDKLIYVVDGHELNTEIALTSGNHNTVVQEWDKCGGSTFTPVAVTVATRSGVAVTSPAANSTVNMIATYAATATSTCDEGVASMGIYVNNQLVYVAQGAKLNTSLNLNPGAQHTVVQEWDKCGGSTYTTVNLNVTDAGTKLSNLQSSKGWESWGQLPPEYVDCAPCSGVEWSTAQNIVSPSITGAATEFKTSGTSPYAVVLWVNPVIGSYSTQALPDTAHTLVPSLHNFTYDTDVYITDLAVTAVLEFDVSMYTGGTGMFFGTQCNHLNGGEWDVLNNVTQQWSKTAAPCNLASGWNHLTLQFERGANNSVLYKSITLNGVTYSINETFAPFSVPASWYGITVNYQMDGNEKQSPNTTYLDNLSLTYW